MPNINPTYRDRVRYTLSHKSYGSREILEPKGWDEDEKEYARHKKYHGVITKFSNSLKFIEDGADYINIVLEQFGVNAEIRLVKEERHPFTDRWFVSYDGVLDLSTWETEEHYVKVKFNSSGLETELKARESDSIEIERLTTLNGVDLEPISTYNVEMEGRKIFLYSEFEADNSTDVVQTDALRRLNSTWGYSSMPVPIKSITKSDELLQNPIPIQYIGQGALSNKPDISHVFYGINDRAKILKIHFSGNFKVKNTGFARIDIDDSAFVKLVLTVYGEGSNFIHKKDYVLWEDDSPKQAYAIKDGSFNETLNLELVEGDSLILRYYTGAENGYDFNRGIFKHEFYDLETKIVIEENSFFEKSSTKMVLAHELGERLLEIITGRKGAFYSEFLGRKELGYSLDGAGSMKGYACGHWLRGFDKHPLDDDNKYKPFTTSFKDFIDDLITTENVGVGIEKKGFRERIVIKPLEEFYINQVTIKLPYQVSKLKRKISSKHYYSSVLIGSTKGWENEEAMGLDEYNTQASFTTPIVRIKNEFKKLTKYIYAPYAAEFIRRKPKEKHPNLDHRNDNEIFSFSLKKVFDSFGLRKWEDDLEKEPTGVYNPESAFNFRYSPVNILLRHGWVVASSLFNHISDYVRFGSSKGNSKLTTKFINQNEYSENQDIQCSDFGLPRYKPMIIEFEHEFDYELKEQLEGTTIVDGKEIQNIYGLIEFINEKGQIERGRFESLKPNGKGKWKLLKAN
ncbi:conserved hypothetical protein [Tenacibaculum sp. 190524A05c]|uniref:hypothetical protein n=1 Tax=Tenacibaculum platacis TaxID=3137852 RepID=UPI0031FAE897